MFGILKTGLKLGIGCFVAGILFVLVVAGLIFYYCGGRPAPRPKSTNRRAAVQQSRAGAATYASMMKAAGVSERPLVQDGDGFVRRIDER
jgi:hypothetical protein